MGVGAYKNCLNKVILIIIYKKVNHIKYFLSSYHPRRAVCSGSALFDTSIKYHKAYLTKNFAVVNFERNACVVC